MSVSLSLIAAAAALAADCGDAQVRLATRAPLQGGVLLVEVLVPSPPPPLALSLDGKPLPLWRSVSGSSFRGLAGIDLERPAGPARLVLEGAGASPCEVPLEVKAGDFVVRRLEVPGRYVELAPRDRARAEKEARRLDELFSTVTPERGWGDAFRLPLDGSEPSGNFGQRRILNGVPRSPHSGVDFGARTGTPVRAPAAGRVVLVGSLFFSGRTVVLDHGLGLYTFYGHLSATTVREGEGVEAGDVLGRVGATGRATGPHLHWSARLGGARVNPLALVGLVGD